MTIHTLEMVVNMQTGSVTSGLNEIEDQIVSLVNQIGNFKPTEIISSNQISAMHSANEALRVSEKLSGAVKAHNIESYAQAERDLNLALGHVEAIQATGVAMQENNALLARKASIESRMTKHYESVKGSLEDHNKLVSAILSGRKSILTVNKEELSNLTKITKQTQDMVRAGIDTGEKLGISKKEAEKLSEFVKDANDNIVEWPKALKQVNTGFSKMLPDVAKFGQLLAPLEMLGSQLKMVNDVYEQNHTVNNNFVADMQSGATVTEAFSTIQQNATKQGILLAESQRALNAVLQSGSVYFSNNSALLEEYVTEVSRAARVTGLNETVLADLALRSDQFGKSIGRTTKLTDTFVNVMADSKLTVSQMSKISGILANDFARLDNQYKIVSKDGKFVAGGADAITMAMGAMAEAAKKAGVSTDAAMDLMAKAIQNPLSIAPLLRGALSSDDIGEQMLAMGESADQYLATYDSLRGIGKVEFLKEIGVSHDQLVAASTAAATMREEIAKLTPAMGEQAAKEKVLTDMAKDKTNSQRAAQAAQESQANATRSLNAAFDQLRIVFGQLAVAMQPILESFAGFVLYITSNDISKWLLVTAGALIALATAMKMVKTFGGITSILKGIGDSSKTMAAGGKGAENIKSFGEGLSGFIKTLSKIKPKKALQAALVIGAVGIAIGVGVAAIGYAASILPPDKAAELLVTLGAITVAMFVVSKMKTSAKNALIGASLLAVVSAALAAGVYLLGIAISTFPPGKAQELLIVTGILAGVMIAAGLIGQIGPTALIGALLLVAVGAALAAGIYWLGLAINTFPPGKAQELLVVSGILTGVMIAAGLMGAVGPTALIGALLLVAVGGALAASIYWLGMAIKSLPAGKAVELLKITAILVGTMLAIALMAPLAGPAMIGALALAVVGASLSAGVALLGLALDYLPSGRATELLAVTGILVGTMLALALMAPLAIPAAIGAVALVAVSAALAAGVALLGVAISKMPSSKAKALAITAGVLVATMAGMALLGAFAIPAIIGSAALVVVAGALAAAIGILVGLGAIDAFAESIDKLGRAIGGLDPSMGSSLVSVAAGLAAFGAALVGNSMVAWIFGVDFIQSAEQLGQAMTTLKDPIMSIASIGPEAGNAFLAIGQGLAAMSTALQGGGLMSFFTGDTVANAKDLAQAMGLVAKPIETIGLIGKETAMVFKLMAQGLRQFVNVLKEDAGWFDSFEDNATDIAAALQKLAKPMQEIIGMQQGNIEDSIKRSAKVQAEEIRSALALTINQSSEKDNLVVEKLEEIRVLLEEGGGTTSGGSNKDLVDEVKKSNDVLQSILDEIGMGGSFASSADTRYNT